MQVNAQGLAIAITQSQMLPKEGPRVIPVTLDFSQAASYDLDLTQLQNQGYFSMLQTIYYDFLTQPPSVNTTVTVNGTGQTIPLSAVSFGYINLLCPNPIKLNFANESGVDVVTIFLINVAIPGVIYGAGV